MCVSPSIESCDQLSNEQPQIPSRSCVQYSAICLSPVREMLALNTFKEMWSMTGDFRTEVEVKTVLHTSCYGCGFGNVTLLKLTSTYHCILKIWGGSGLLHLTQQNEGGALIVSEARIPSVGSGKGKMCASRLDSKFFWCLTQNQGVKDFFQLRTWLLHRVLRQALKGNDLMR